MSRRAVAAVAGLLLLGTGVAVARAIAPAAGGGRPFPPGWREVAAGPAGGSVWTGVIANPYDPRERPSAVYLPPGYSPSLRYPVLYLLHGLSGSPAEFFGSLHLARVMDDLVETRRVTPMIVVMPAGADSNSAEWAGAWEKYVVRNVVPWVDARLPAIRSAHDRVLAGLCAGGYGAMDIGLRHARLFGALESWEGYFAPVFRDGPFRHATAVILAGNDPTLLVRREAPSLRRDSVRFYVSVGGNHGDVLRIWSLDFSRLLGRLGLRHTLWQLPRSRAGRFWSATLPSALEFASASAGGRSSTAYSS